MDGCVLLSSLSAFSSGLKVSFKTTFECLVIYLFYATNDYVASLDIIIVILSHNSCSSSATTTADSSQLTAVTCVFVMG